MPGKHNLKTKYWKTNANRGALIISTARHQTGQEKVAPLPINYFSR